MPQDIDVFVGKQPTTQLQQQKKGAEKKKKKKGERVRRGKKPSPASL